MSLRTPLFGDGTPQRARPAFRALCTAQYLHTPALRGVRVGVARGEHVILDVLRGTFPGKLRPAQPGPGPSKPAVVSWAPAALGHRNVTHLHPTPQHGSLVPMN